MRVAFMWFAYLHINGTMQYKRYFVQRDIDEANQSPYVQKVFGPLEAIDRSDAIKKFNELENDHA